MIFYYIIAILILGILILIHELGHFIFAKLFKVKVEEFSLGFGPKIFGFKYGETEYKISAVPFGGYVKMIGEDPNDERTGAPNEFASKPAWQRIIIVLAGPFVNLIFGFIIFMLIYWGIGSNIQGYLPKIGDVLYSSVSSDGDTVASPAMIAGLKRGDEIISIDNIPMETFFDIQRTVRNSNGKELKFIVKRKNKTLTKNIIPELNTRTGQYYVGFTGFEEPIIGNVIPDFPAYNAGLRPGDKVISVNGITCEQFIDVKRDILFSRTDTIKIKAVRDNKEKIFDVVPVKKKIPTQVIEEYKGDTFYYNGRVIIDAGEKEIFISQIGILPSSRKLRFSFLKSMKLSKDETIYIIDKTIWTLKLLITNKVSLKNLAGPLGIIQITGERAAAGFEELLRLTALLTISLWFINLMPIPVLDGGWVIFLIYESIFRKPVHQKLQGILQNVFFALLISLLLYVTYGDATRWWDEHQQIKESRTHSEVIKK